MNSERLRTAARWARDTSAALLAVMALRLAYFAAVTTMAATESNPNDPTLRTASAHRGAAAGYRAGSEGRPGVDPRTQGARLPPGPLNEEGQRVLAAAELALLARGADESPRLLAGEEVLMTISMVTRGPRGELWAGDQHLGKTPFLGQVRCRLNNEVTLRLERPGRAPSTFSRPCRSGTLTLVE